MAGRLAVLLIPVGVVAVLVLLHPLTRRQDREAPLMFGADSGTRRAVRRALRTGHAPDARIDALARDTATRTLCTAWQLRLFIGIIVLQIIGAVLRALGDADPLPIGLSPLFIVSFGAALASMVVNRRRSRTYLGTPPHPTTPGAES